MTATQPPNPQLPKAATDTDDTDEFPKNSHAYRAHAVRANIF